MSAETLRRAAEEIRSDAPFGTPDGNEFFLAVADWLEHHARQSAIMRVEPGSYALAVARAYLGEAE